MFTLLLVALGTALTVAQGGERFQPLSREFLVALAEEISKPMTPPLSGLVARILQELALTPEKIAKLPEMKIETIYLIYTSDVTEIMNKKG